MLLRARESLFWSWIAKASFAMDRHGLETGASCLEARERSWDDQT